LTKEWSYYHGRIYISGINVIVVLMQMMMTDERNTNRFISLTGSRL